MHVFKNAFSNFKFVHILGTTSNGGSYYTGVLDATSWVKSDNPVG
jgi:hypothetical protein